jgi:cathepsin L
MLKEIIVIVALMLVQTNGVFFSSNSTFSDFLSHHKLEINSDEYEYRNAIYLKEQQRINQHNSKNKDWLEGLNHMSIMTKDERKKYYGYSKSINQYTKLNHPILNSKLSIELFNQDNLPNFVDWRNKEGVVTAVKSQGSCGSCWAFASTAVIESHLAINTGKLFDLSTQQIATCSPNPNQCGGQGNCGGATAELAFEYVSNSAGLYDEFQLPYTEFYGQESQCVIPSGTTPKAKISGYVKLEENNYEQLVHAVANYGPIAISVDASSWHAYSSGVFDGCNQLNPDINHAVVLMGYGTDDTTSQDYWLVRNSWSASWGENGYIRLLRRNPTNPINSNDNVGEEDFCGLDITPQDGTACESQTQPVKVCGTCGILYDSSYPTGVNIF